MDSMYIRKIIKEELQKVLSEGHTPEQRTALKAKEKELYGKWHDLEEERIDIGLDIESAQDELKDATSEEKVSLRKQIVALKKKQEAKKEQADAAWETYEATKKKLGPKYDSRRSKD